MSAKKHFLILVTLALSERCLILCKDIKRSTNPANSSQATTCNAIFNNIDGNMFSKSSNVECQNSQICQKTFNIFEIHVLPYTYGSRIKRMISKCCGACAKFNTTTYVDGVRNFTTDLIKNEHFVSPILAREETTGLYGFHFVPFINMRKTVFITRKTHGKFIKFCKKMAPFVVICILLAIIAGFIAWAMEYRVNEDIPAPFFPGQYAGFWWAFVTMTTVGYGDITMKTGKGKLFAAVWIMLGIFIFGLLTGELTNYIMEMKQDKGDIKGGRIGVLKDRQFDKYMVSQYGGIPVSNDDDEMGGVQCFRTDMLVLIEKLKKKELDGILIDAYTMRHFVGVVHAGDAHGERWENAIHFFLYQTLLHERDYNGDPLAYGLLIKQKEDYLFFRDAIAEIKLQLELTWEVEWRKLQAEGKMKVPEEGWEYNSKSYDLQVIVGCVGVIALLFMGGLVYERKRRNMKMCELEKIEQDHSPLDAWKEM